MEGKKDRKGIGGAPSLFKPEYCNLLIEHMKKGLSYDSFAAVVNCHLDTLYHWEKAHPEFLEAKKSGKAHSLLFWEKMGIEHLVVPKGLTFNSSIWIFNMRNRFGWRDDPRDLDDQRPIKIELVRKASDS